MRNTLNEILFTAAITIVALSGLGFPSAHAETGALIVVSVVDYDPYLDRMEWCMTSRQGTIFTLDSKYLVNDPNLKAICAVDGPGEDGFHEIRSTYFPNSNELQALSFRSQLQILLQTPSSFSEEQHLDMLLESLIAFGEEELSFSDEQAGLLRQFLDQLAAFVVPAAYAQGGLIDDIARWAGRYLGPRVGRRAAETCGDDVLKGLARSGRSGTWTGNLGREMMRETTNVTKSFAGKCSTTGLKFTLQITLRQVGERVVYTARVLIDGVKVVKGKIK